VSLLEAQGISKRFDGILALDGVDLRVDTGEFAALIGPNGAGKSTLFNCLTGVIPADGGSVTFDGVNLRGRSTSARARLGIAQTFQRVELFGGMTVRDHLIVADRARIGRSSLLGDLFARSSGAPGEIERCDRVLELVDIAELADEPAEALPLGRARLVELARALAAQPRLLFLDEPSSGLDRTETEAMSAVLRNVSDTLGTTIVLIEHDVAMVGALAESVWVLDGGQLIASGPTKDVFDDAKVRSAYLGNGT
jgi:branched-chain amino acid transport system ATP-binding protein